MRTLEAKFWVIASVPQRFSSVLDVVVSGRSKSAVVAQWPSSSATASCFFEVLLIIRHPVKPTTRMRLTKISGCCCCPYKKLKEPSAKQSIHSCVMRSIGALNASGINPKSDVPNMRAHSKIKRLKKGANTMLPTKLMLD